MSSRGIVTGFKFEWKKFKKTASKKITKKDRSKMAITSTCSRVLVIEHTELSQRRLYEYAFDLYRESKNEVKIGFKSLMCR